MALNRCVALRKKEKYGIENNFEMQLVQSPAKDSSDSKAKKERDLGLV